LLGRQERENVKAPQQRDRGQHLQGSKHACLQAKFILLCGNCALLGLPNPDTLIPAIEWRLDKIRA